MSRLSLVQDHNREEKKAKLTLFYEATEWRTIDSKHDGTWGFSFSSCCHIQLQPPLAYHIYPNNKQLHFTVLNIQDTQTALSHFVHSYKETPPFDRSWIRKKFPSYT
jgi:hypothetical protein